MSRKKNQADNSAPARFVVWEVRRPGHEITRMVFGRDADNRDLEPIRYVREFDKDGGERTIGPLTGWR